jgi:chromate reductase
VVGASTGLFGAVWAQAETRKALSIAGADVLEDEFPLGQADIAFDDDGTLLDSELNERLGEIVGRLADHQRELTTAA